MLLLTLFAVLETLKCTTFLQKWNSSCWWLAFLFRWYPNIKYLSKALAGHHNYHCWFFIRYSVTWYRMVCAGLNEFLCYVFFLQKMIKPFFSAGPFRILRAANKKGKPNQYLFSSQRLNCSRHGPIALPGKALEHCWSFRVGTVVISVWFSFDILQVWAPEVPWGFMWIERALVKHDLMQHSWIQDKAKLLYFLNSTLSSEHLICTLYFC